MIVDIGLGNPTQCFDVGRCQHTLRQNGEESQKFNEGLTRHQHGDTDRHKVCYPQTTVCRTSASTGLISPVGIMHGAPLRSWSRRGPVHASSGAGVRTSGSTTCWPWRRVRCPWCHVGKWVQAQAQAQEVTPLTKQHAQMLSWNSELPPHSQPTNTSCIRRWDELPQHPPHQTLSFFAMNIKHYKISKMNFIFQRISLLLEPKFCLWWNLQ